jgi:hypothetical protein
MRRVWNPLYIGIITYFCLVLPGVILFAINFEKLGKPRLKMPMLVVGSLGFIALIWAWLFLPKEWDTPLAIIHMGSSIGLAAWQYSSYRKFLDENEDVQVESLFKPALLSVLFLIVLVSIGLSWTWYQHEQLKKDMQLAMQDYDLGNYKDAVSKLKVIVHDFPMENLGYTNLSITYETMGHPDSAILVMENWLEKMPEDAAAKERLYQLRYTSRGKE